MKILFITNIPSPYRVEFFNCWGEFPGVNLTVVFLERPEEHKGRSAKWFRSDYTHFKAVFLQDKVKIKNHIIYKDIFRWLKKEYDEIIFGGYAEPTYMAAMEYLKLHHIPYGIEVDGGLINKDSLPKFMIKKHFLGSAEFWFSSGKVASEYLVHYGANPSGIIEYPFTSMMEMDLRNALGGSAISSANNDDEQSWRNIRENYRNESREILGIKEKVISLSVGRFIEGKGFGLLIDMIPQLDRSTGYYFVGGKMTSDIDEYIKKYNLTNIHLIDFKTPDELAFYFRAADLFVLPTLHDVWGLVVSEAMAYGLPVVTTDLCGAGLELVEEGKNGALCHAGDKMSLKNALEKVMQMDLNHLGFQSYKKIQRYTIENMALAHFNYFKNKRDRN
ncbi:glycosyltransferase family 4 protein [Mitsuokella multacida]|uniref:glycosyltransferase family 4 protein n=1 Tax=Mitsuokella multacida TaxID=52226 RepID=UPI0022E61DD1|nr:glycosyltransferase [Mitsuokella multacida]